MPRVTGVLHVAAYETANLTACGSYVAVRQNSERFSFTIPSPFFEDILSEHFSLLLLHLLKWAHARVLVFFVHLLNSTCPLTCTAPK